MSSLGSAAAALPNDRPAALSAPEQPNGGLVAIEEEDVPSGLDEPERTSTT
jgi:hypothetical protein